MRAPPSRWARWRVAGVALGVATVVGAVLVVRYAVLDDSTTAVGTARAVENFREQNGGSAPTTATPATPADPSASPDPTSSAPATTEAPSTTEPPDAVLVEPGVYEYRTTGFESIDAVGGTRHDYPDVTTMTVLPDGCGVSVRWDALAERWERWRLCGSTEGVLLQPDGAQYHEFFGQSERERLRCDRSVLLVPADGSARAARSQTCTMGRTDYRPTWEVLGSEVRVVAGEPVDVVHTRMRVDDTDRYWEQITIDWFLTSGGLPVEVVASRESLSSTFVGDVRYEEEYRLLLQSTEPLR